MKRINNILFFLLVVLAFHTGAYAAAVPDTGQTGDYTDTFGEDSDYTINPPSYTKLGANGVELADSAIQNDGWIMTRDNVTGLVWEMKTDDGSIHDKDNTYTWCDTNPATNGGDQGTCGDGTDTEDFIATLNTTKYGGYNDWRMPTPGELQSIVDYGRTNPSVNTSFFPNTKSLGYWSSTTDAYHTRNAWRVDFGDGVVDSYLKYRAYYVRAVRSGQSGSLGNLIINGDGTVTDTATGLMWQQQDDGTEKTWNGAITYAENLSLGGYSDWRLPTAKELQSIVDYGRVYPSVNTTFFPDTVVSGYWSSTTYAGSASLAWRVYFGYGDVYYSNKSYTYYVRAVRSGQTRSFGHLVILAPTQGARWEVGTIQSILWDTQNLGGNVSIALSRDGGKTFSEILAASTPNDGSFDWTVSGSASPNCVLTITPLVDTSMATTQGLFSINSFPVIAQTGPLNVIMDEDGEWVEQALTATDPDGDPLTWSIATHPVHGKTVVSGTGASPSVLTYVPNADWSGNDVFVIKVMDGNGGAAVINVNVTVSSIQDAPVATSDMRALEGKESLVIGGLLGNDSDAESDPLSIASFTQPSSGTLTDNGDGRFTYVRGDSFANSDSFTYQVSDGNDGTDTGYVFIMESPVGGNPVPDTGQTSDYTDTFGEDSDYCINPPSYTKLGANGVELPESATQNDGWIMTRDNVTGLVWEMKTDDGSIHDKDNTYTWCDTNPATNGGNQGTCGNGTDTEDFIATLNANKYGGYNDWRMPTPGELQSIVDYGQSSPSVNTSFFPNTVSSYYWSSTTHVNKYWGWRVGFDYGYVGVGYNKSYSYYVRAVRSGQSRSFNHLVINGDGTVTDTATGLMWQQDDGTEKTWENAIIFAENLSLGGHSDWRLPTAKELQSIVDYGRRAPSVNTTFFPGTVLSYYWSSTTHAYNANRAWQVYFSYGLVDGDLGYKYYTYYVRAVRSGQSWSLGHLVILAPQQGSRLGVGSVQPILWDPQDLGGNVSIALSRDGGKTFSEILADSTPNDGTFDWTVSSSTSFNCVLKITPLVDTSKGTTQGLFSIFQPSLVFATTSMPNGVLNLMYSEQIVLTGGSVPYTFSHVGSLPDGLALDSETGIISGSPTMTGAFDFTIRVSDSGSPSGVAEKHFTIHVLNPVSINTNTIQGGSQDSQYSVTLAGHGGLNPLVWSLSDGALPEGLTLNATTGVISGTPGDCGDFGFTVHLSDSSEPPITADILLHLTVICSDDYTLSGAVTLKSATVPGETLLCSVIVTGKDNMQTTSSNDGHFEFQHLKNGTYTITPKKPGYAFDPESITVENMKKDTSANFEMYRLPGDINGDGDVSIKDCILALKILSGLNPETNIYPVAFHNGKVEIKDVLGILQKVGKE